MVKRNHINNTINNMRNRNYILIILLLIINLAYGQLQLDVYALEGVTIIDANNPKPLVNQTVVIKGQTIYKIFPTNSIKLPDSISVFKLKGKYLIPGLIDTHVHLTGDENNRAETEAVLKKMLLSGITSVRDMLGDARTLASLKRDALV